MLDNPELPTPNENKEEYFGEFFEKKEEFAKNKRSFIILTGQIAKNAKIS